MLPVTPLPARALSGAVCAFAVFVAAAQLAFGQSTASPAAARFADQPVVITAADCTSTRLGAVIPASAIGEPVSGVTLAEPRWVPQDAALPARCEVDGQMAPVDATGRVPAINFRVWLPAAWNHRAVQQGGAGINGVIPDLRGVQYPIDGRSPAEWGFVTYGSDSGHQAGSGRRGGPPRGGGPLTETAALTASGRGAQPGRGPGGVASNDWALTDEAIRNLGYMQMKKTHDAAMVIMQRVYGERPRFNYFTGTSQGGREALTVAQRYPADYDGIIANVPIVSFSSLMLAPGADPHPGEAARQLGHARQDRRDPRPSSCASATTSMAWPTASSTTTWRAAPSST